MDKLELIKAYLLKNRNQSNANLELEEDFNPDDHAGGNIVDMDFTGM